MGTVICLAAIVAAGCHGQPNISGYGIAWVTLTDEPSDYTSYVVTIDSVTFTRNDGAVVTAVGTPEIVDLTQVHNIAELWSSGAIPEGTYVSATITVDYTSAAISVLRNGVPTTATVLDYTTHTAPTTYAVTVNFDPHDQPTITGTYASTSALLLAIDFNLAASGWVAQSKDGPVVYVQPFFTIGHLPDDTKLIRSSRTPHQFEAPMSARTPCTSGRSTTRQTTSGRSRCSASRTPSTRSMVSLTSAVRGSQHCRVLSAGTTMTAGYTTFQPDFNPLNSAYAGRFNLAYVVAGSTLEDIYTNGITGEVIARDGNTLTLQGSTVILTSDDTFAYEVADTQVLLGPGTIVTADDNSALTDLNSDAVAVGQRHHRARHLQPLDRRHGQLDSTGTSSDNTGSVRLISTELWGSAGLLGRRQSEMDLQTIDDFPVSLFKFAGNGSTAAQNPVPATFSVTAPGLSSACRNRNRRSDLGRRCVDGFRIGPARFQGLRGQQRSLGTSRRRPAGRGPSTAPGIGICGIGSQVCEPASLEVVWRGTGAAPLRDICRRGLLALTSTIRASFTPRPFGSDPKRSI